MLGEIKLIWDPSLSHIHKKIVRLIFALLVNRREREREREVFLSFPELQVSKGDYFANMYC